MTEGNRGLSPDALDALLARDDTPRQISPDANGYVLEVGGTPKGYIKVDTVDKKLTFLWASASEAWPSQFVLIKPSGGLPMVNEVEVYEHASFPSTTTSVDVSTCDYKIIQNSQVIGYLRRRSDGLDWYATTSAPSGGYFTTDPMTFVANSSSGTQSLHHVDDAAT